MRRFSKIFAYCILSMVMINLLSFSKVEAASKITNFKNSKVQNLRLKEMSNNCLTLEWDALEGATGYKVLRATEKDGKYSNEIGTTDTGFVDETAKYGVTYYYKIYGETLYKGEVYLSKAAIFKIIALPDKPVVNITTQNNEVKLKIQKVKNADGYKIYMAASKDGTFEAIKTIKTGESLTYVKSNLQNGKYYFKVRAYSTQNGKKYYGKYSTIMEANVSTKQADVAATPVSAFKYKVIDGKATITELTDHSFEKVVIPHEIDGYPVISIARDTFYTLQGSRVKEVVVPEGVTTLEPWAFYSCSAEKIILPNSLTTIGTLEEGNRLGVFPGCINLKEINIPNNVKFIGTGTFNGCSSLEKIKLPDTIEYIGNKAFYNCEKLKSITLPKNLKKIGESAFSRCESLKSVVIPGSVKIIGENAFFGCEKLEKVILEEGIEEIGIYAFDYCNKLVEITIPGSVISFNFDILNYDLDDGVALEKIILSEGIRRISYIVVGTAPKYIYIPKSVTVIDKSNDGFSYYMRDRYVIITPKGSYAEKWFTERNIPVITE